MCVGVPMTWCTPEVREQLVRVDLRLSHMGSRDWSQLVRLGRQQLCPASHLILNKDCLILLLLCM